ncbi:sigma-70 family RNA polymerase sigma factor [Limnobacter humi]|uniref:Sigma-70 family RNA polymerase sigma factor n=1 Tax=Limnobacter humi TaxID=1778671 RepID=A0ABT1WDA2_9BURK|nr:sigma-70 family RNA polymerase sigma factor [Limnobacter humi]MCQ8895497.1 sigma-70 family RNA polymerase sigma factor [Limnobacter humi]
MDYQEPEPDDFDYEAALLACARGEQFALQAIYARDGRWLFSVALRITKRAELAEEVLHDAMIKVWKRSKLYSPALGSARGWVYTVVRNQALNMIRRGKQELSTEDLNLPELSVDENEHLADEATRMHHCLGHLDEVKRNAIVLAFVEGYTHEQIAQRLNSPLGSVKSWIRRGLLKLKECLS